MTRENASYRFTGFAALVVAMSMLMASIQAVSAASSFASPSASERAEAALRRAQTQRGVHEVGGENMGIPLQRYVRYFNPSSGPQPWCAFFVSWSLATSGYSVPWRNAGYVDSVRSWAGSTSRIVAQPRHGDLFLYGSGANAHMGFVQGANANTGEIWTIEGNSSDRVNERRRNYPGDPLRGQYIFIRY